MRRFRQVACIHKPLLSILALKVVVRTTGTPLFGAKASSRSALEVIRPSGAYGWWAGIGTWGQTDVGARSGGLPLALRREHEYSTDKIREI